MAVADCNEIGLKIIRTDGYTKALDEDRIYKDAFGKTVASVKEWELIIGFDDAVHQLRIEILGRVIFRSRKSGMKSACQYIVKTLSKKGYHVVSGRGEDVARIYGPYGAGKIGFYQKNYDEGRRDIVAYRKGTDRPLYVDSAEEAEAFILADF